MLCYSLSCSLWHSFVVVMDTKIKPGATSPCFSRVSMICQSTDLLRPSSLLSLFTRATLCKQNVALFQLKATTQPHRQMTAVRLADCWEASSLSLHFHPPDFLPQSLWLWKKTKKHLHWNYSTSWGLNKIRSPQNNNRKRATSSFSFFFLLLNMCKNLEDACEQKGGGAEEQPVNTLADTRSSSRPTTLQHWRRAASKRKKTHWFHWVFFFFYFWSYFLILHHKNINNAIFHFEFTPFFLFTFLFFFFFYWLACLRAFLPLYTWKEQRSIISQ